MGNLTFGTPRALAKAKPTGPKLTDLTGQFRVRKDKVDKNGKVTLRYRGRLLHIGMGWANRGRRVIMLVDGRDVRVMDEDGELIRHLGSTLPATTREWI